MGFAGVVKAEDLLGLFGKKFFGFRKESEGGIAVEDEFKVGDFVGVGRNGSGSGRVFFGRLDLCFLRGFGYEERGGEGAWIWEFRVRI